MKSDKALSFYMIIEPRVSPKITYDHFLCRYKMEVDIYYAELKVIARGVHFLFYLEIVSTDRMTLKIFFI